MKKTHPTDHRPALVVFMLTAILLLAGCGQAPETTGKSIFAAVDAGQAKSLLNERRGQPDFIILDIRTPQEFTQGHIEGAINIDYYAADFQQQLASLDRSKTYFVYCRSGNRSGSSLQIFDALKFTDIIHLQHGLRDWQGEGLPVVK